MKRLALILLAAGWFCSVSYAQRVLFDFDGISAHAPLPVTVTAGGVIANCRPRVRIVCSAGFAGHVKTNPVGRNVCVPRRAYCAWLAFVPHCG